MRVYELIEADQSVFYDLSKSRKRNAASAKPGKGLSSGRKRTALRATEQCAWGTIQGSGKNPYQTCIDLSGPAFKCTCPSRKVPCKHRLGLFLVLAQQPGEMKERTHSGVGHRVAV
jgi:uncharacterized Zn finger protein